MKIYCYCPLCGNLLPESLDCEACGYKVPKGYKQHMSIDKPIQDQKELDFWRDKFIKTLKETYPKEFQKTYKDYIKFSFAKVINPEQDRNLFGYRVNTDNMPYTFYIPKLKDKDIGTTFNRMTIDSQKSIDKFIQNLNKSKAKVETLRKEFNLCKDNRLKIVEELENKGLTCTDLGFKKDFFNLKRHLLCFTVNKGLALDIVFDRIESLEPIFWIKTKNKGLIDNILDNQPKD